MKLSILSTCCVTLLLCGTLYAQPPGGMGMGGGMGDMSGGPGGRSGRPPGAGGDMHKAPGTPQVSRDDAYEQMQAQRVSEACKMLKLNEAKTQKVEKIAKQERTRLFAKMTAYCEVQSMENKLLIQSDDKFVRYETRNLIQPIVQKFDLQYQKVLSAEEYALWKALEMNRPETQISEYGMVMKMLCTMPAQGEAPVSFEDGWMNVQM